MLENCDPKAARALAYLASMWTPHKGQKAAGDAVFNSKADFVYVECGRKFGKSELATFMCWIYALTRPNAEVYYLAPAVKLAKELVWANQRMQTANTYDPDFIPTMERLLGGEIKIFKQEGRIVLPNGSFIKVDGSDNIDNQLGLKPDFVVADEYRTFKPEWLEFMRPNMAPKKGKICFITTPPLGPNHAYDMAQECKSAMEAKDPHYFYLNLPSSVNDRLPGHDMWLAREKDRLFRLGREREWRREYLAEYLASDDHAVLPGINRHFARSPESLYQLFKSRSRDTFEWACVIDPGNSTFLGALFLACSKNSGDVFVLGELKLEASQDVTARTAWPRLRDSLQAIKDELVDCPMPSEWPVYVNERCSGFVSELFGNFEVTACCFDKALVHPEANITLIKDICAANKLHVGENSKDLLKEAESFQRSPETLKIPQDEDRPLVRCLQAGIVLLGYSYDLLEVAPEIDPKSVLVSDELFFGRLKKVKTFEEKAEELQMDLYGILPGDDFVFGSDIEKWDIQEEI